MGYEVEESQDRRIQGLEEQIKGLSLKLKQFREALSIEIKVNGGYWWITRRPRGKGSSKLGGTYIRVPGQK